MLHVADTTNAMRREQLRFAHIYTVVVQLQQVFKIKLICFHTGPQLFSLLVSGHVSDWLLQTRPHHNITLLKLIHILYHQRPIHCLLHDTPNFVVYWIWIQTVWGQSSGPTNCGVSEKLGCHEHIVQVHWLAGNTNVSPMMLQIAVSSHSFQQHFITLVAAINLHIRIHKHKHPNNPALRPQLIRTMSHFFIAVGT